MTVATDRPEAAKVQEKFGEGLLKVKVFRDELYLCVRRNIIPQVLEFLKTDEDLAYVYFSECVGIDYSRWDHERDLPERFEVVYNLISIQNRSRVFVKVGVDDGQKIPTCKHVFTGAEYPEREINDLFGVIFEGNEQTDRFLLPDDWVGYPLRKEYPLGGEDVNFDQGTRGPAVEDKSTPHAGESFEGKTGSEDVSGR